MQSYFAAPPSTQPHEAAIVGEIAGPL